MCPDRLHQRMLQMTEVIKPMMKRKLHQCRFDRTLRSDISARNDAICDRKQLFHLQT
jgi:hypothetical protein